MQKLSHVLLGLAVIALGATTIVQYQINASQNAINKSVLETVELQFEWSRGQSQRIDTLNRRIHLLEQRTKPLPFRGDW